MINPETFIEQENRPPIILDEEQEKLVMEDIQQAEEDQKSKVKAETFSIFETEFGIPDPMEDTGGKEVLPQPAKKLVSNTSVRLVRGVMGSGKTLVLVARAKYLARNNPDWKILVLTFLNKPDKALKKELKEFNNMPGQSYAYALQPDHPEQ